MALRGGSCGGTRPASLLAVLVLAQAAAAFQLSAAPSPARFVGASPRARARSARGALPALAANAASATGDRVRLAGGLEVSPLGVGAWAWGDRLFWGYDDSQEAAAQQAFNAAVDLGVNLFDTAEVYGAGADPNSWGYSEVLCGQFARQYQGPSQEEVLVATKFAPLPHRFFDGRRSVQKALRASLQRLGTDRIDLYQLHWPGFFADAAFWDGLADSYEAGLVRSVGVSNYSEKRLRAVHKALADRGVPLATNQVLLAALPCPPAADPRAATYATCRSLHARTCAAREPNTLPHPRARASPKTHTRTHKHTHTHTHTHPGAVQPDTPHARKGGGTGVRRTRGQDSGLLAARTGHPHRTILRVQSPHRSTYMHCVCVCVCVFLHV